MSGPGRWLRGSILGMIAALFPTVAVAQDTPAEQEADLLAGFTEQVEALHEELVDVRRDIHRHPELSGQEERTAGIVADRLSAAGFEVRTGVGGHGVIGLLHGAEPGPLIAFRADMDAVRSNAPDPVEFRSEIKGVRHICGHDIHTTVGLALAEGFAAIRDRMPGSVMLLFQPAEESARGAQAMLADGALLDPVPDAIFAYHTAPFEVGVIATALRTLMPGRDGVRMEIRGEGDLESVAQAVRELVLTQGTVDRRDATTPVTGEFVLVQGARASRGNDATGGDEANGWEVRATLTTSSTEASRRAREAIQQGLQELERPGLSLGFNYRERVIAGVTNEPDLVEAANSSARVVLGEDAVVLLDAMSPLFSEDFGSFQEEVPGVMYFLGVSNSERGWVGMPHSPDYMADEEAIFLGARAMAAVFLDLFAHGLPDGGR